MRPVASILATVEATIDAHLFNNIDSVAEAFKTAKRAVESATRSLEDQTATSVLAAIAVAKEKTKEAKEMVDQEVNRVERLKREQKHASNVFSKMSSDFAAAFVRSEIEKVNEVQEVVQNYQIAAELIDNASPFFAHDDEGPDEEDKKCHHSAKTHPNHSFLTGNSMPRPGEGLGHGSRAQRRRKIIEK